MNPSCLPWKCRTLTTELPGKTQKNTVKVMGWLKSSQLITFTPVAPLQGSAWVPAVTLAVKRQVTGNRGLPVAGGHQLPGTALESHDAAFCLPGWAQCQDTGDGPRNRTKQLLTLNCMGQSRQTRFIWNIIGIDWVTAWTTMWKRARVVIMSIVSKGGGDGQVAAQTSLEKSASSRLTGFWGLGEGWRKG